MPHAGRRDDAPVLLYAPGPQTATDLHCQGGQEGLGNLSTRVELLRI